MVDKQEFITDPATGKKFPLIRVKPAPQDEAPSKKLPDLNSTAEELIKEYARLKEVLKTAQKKPLTKEEVMNLQRRLMRLQRKEKVLFVRRNFGKIPISQRLQAELNMTAINVERNLSLVQQAQKARIEKRRKLRDLLKTTIKNSIKNVVSKRRK